MPQKTFLFHGDAFAIFKKFYGKCNLFFLDSSRLGNDGNFSYIGFDPKDVIRGHDINLLKQAIQKHRSKFSQALFSGGALGYIGYEGKYCFGVYDQVLAIDHKKSVITIHCRTKKQMDDMCAALNSSLSHVPVLNPGPIPLVYKSNFTKTEYVAMVKKALNHIRQGYIYQINCSRKIWLDVPKEQKIDPVALYGALRVHSPSPFSAYFDDGRQIVLSSSPERFLKLSNRTVQVKPMKGTRSRGTNKLEDARLKKDLLNSSKEIAELLMVTDLERNDLGRVCEYGSVNVKSMRTIEEYKTVFQATALIEGKLHKTQDQFDLLRATFPSGSVTGCPKIEAMKIIKKLEGTSRGLYTGALGYIGFNGDMDFSVLIRTLFLEKQKISFHVGGGIVADSNPLAEYEETCVKARAIEAALQEIL